MEILSSRVFQVGVLTGVGGVVLSYGLLLIVGVVVRPWIMAWSSGVRVGIPHLIGMRLRKADPDLVIGAHIVDVKRGARHTLISLEVAYLAFSEEIRGSGDLLRVADRELAKRSGGAA